MGTTAKILILALLVMGLLGCKLEEPGLGEEAESSVLKIKLTDSPGDFNEVNVEIKKVSVHQQNFGWKDLETNGGIYNLLDYTNGFDTLIAMGEVEASSITEMRFELGTNNTIVVDSVEHDLEAPVVEAEGINIKLDQVMEPGVDYVLVADWDAGKGVVRQGMGKYSLKPVIRVYAEAVSGSVQGNVDPDVVSYVYAVNVEGGDTLGTYTTVTGDFLLRGVPEGTYNLYIDGGSSFNLYVLRDVNVTTGNVSSVGRVNLKMFWEGNN